MGAKQAFDWFLDPYRAVSPHPGSLKVVKGAKESRPCVCDCPGHTTTDSSNYFIHAYLTIRFRAKLPDVKHVIGSARSLGCPRLGRSFTRSSGLAGRVGSLKRRISNISGFPNNSIHQRQHPQPRFVPLDGYQHATPEIVRMLVSNQAHIFSNVVWANIIKPKLYDAGQRSLGLKKQFCKIEVLS